MNTDPVRITYRFTGSTYTARAGKGRAAVSASATSCAAAACRRAAAKYFGFTKNEADYLVGRAAAIVLNPEPKKFSYEGGHTFATKGDA